MTKSSHNVALNKESVYYNSIASGLPNRQSNYVSSKAQSANKLTKSKRANKTKSLV